MARVLEDSKVDGLLVSLNGPRNCVVLFHIDPADKVGLGKVISHSSVGQVGLVTNTLLWISSCSMSAIVQRENVHNSSGYHWFYHIFCGAPNRLGKGVGSPVCIRFMEELHRCCPTRSAGPPPMQSAELQGLPDQSPFSVYYGQY